MNINLKPRTLNIVPCRPLTSLLVQAGLNKIREEQTYTELGKSSFTSKIFGKLLAMANIDHIRIMTYSRHITGAK